MTDRKGLGMYYEEQWIEGALCWRTSPNGAWTRYTANELAHRYESAEKRAADAQATVDLAKAEGAAEVRKVIQQRLIDVRLARSVARLSFAQDEYDAQISALESILKQCEEPFSSNNENGPDWQATVEALQAQLVTLKRHAGLDCGDQSCLYALEHSGMRTNGGCRCSPKRMKDDLERSRKAVEALQRERDEARKRVDELEAREVDVVLLRDELDAEREKRTALLAEIDEGLTLSDNLLAIRTVTALYDELAQLQALVRALPVLPESDLHLDEVWARLKRGNIGIDLVLNLLRYRAALDATTPATTKT